MTAPDPALAAASSSVTDPTTDLAAWDAFVAAARPTSYLQLSGWGRVKAINGWSASRVVASGRAGAESVGAQIAATPASACLRL